jgi:transcriptional regulator with XRE-family HTH domain
MLHIHNLALDWPTMSENRRHATYLRKLRERRGVSLPWLADETGIEKGNLSRIERGLQPLRVTQLHKIAEALGVTSLAEALDPYVEEDHIGEPAKPDSIG